jgi:hypothetical protein
VYVNDSVRYLIAILDVQNLLKPRPFKFLPAYRRTPLVRWKFQTYTFVSANEITVFNPANHKTEDLSKLAKISLGGKNVQYTSILRCAEVLEQN